MTKANAHAPRILITDDEKKVRQVNKASAHAPRILITDDEEDIRWTLKALMKREGFEPLEAADGETALRIMRQELLDAVILDIRLPDKSGIEVLKEAKKFDARTPIILITGFAGLVSAEDAVSSGAYRYMTKPFEMAELLAVVREAVKSNSLKQWRDPGRSAGEGGVSLRDIMGSSDQIRQVMADVELVAPTNFTVLVTGETGSGKEMVAKAIHHLSPRANAPFVPVDCGSIPPTLLESELFGHEKGSYTGADRSEPGKFEIASTGTLFLDEISNLPLAVQPKLLRALQEKKIWRVGGKKPIEVDIRVVAASNQNLTSMMDAGHFRRELYYRLNEFSITVPPLRKRREDLIFLAKQFLELTNEELEKNVLGFSNGALEHLQSYEWPGNVRELRNVIRRAVLVADTYITGADLDISDGRHTTASPPLDLGKESDGNRSLKELVRSTVAQLEKEAIAKVLGETNGNKAKAARILRIDNKTLYKKIKEYDISP